MENPGPQPTTDSLFDKLRQVERELAASRTDAARKLKEGAVKINGEVCVGPRDGTIIRTRPFRVASRPEDEACPNLFCSKLTPSLIPLGLW